MNFLNDRSDAGYRRRARVFAAIGVLCILVGLSLMAGCTNTVAPKQASSGRPSWDGSSQNSGFIGFDQAGNGILTAHARDRYNELMDRYGKKFSPPVRQDDGLTATATNTWLIDPQHLSSFMTANRWRKQELPTWGSK